MTRPAFELEMQEPPRQGERLTNWKDLEGETILAVFEDYETKDGETVFVTDTLCWLVIAAENDGYCGEDDLSIHVIDDQFGKQPKMLSDFVHADFLFEKGCITHAAHAELKAREEAAKAASTKERINRLRAEAARLEREAGGAA